MPKIVKPLTAIEVKRLDGEGFHMVGTVSGLGLKIIASGARSWILRTQIKSRRTDIHLSGGFIFIYPKAYPRTFA
jgi:hypothetical protein